MLAQQVPLSTIQVAQPDDDTPLHDEPADGTQAAQATATQTAPIAAPHQPMPPAAENARVRANSWPPITPTSRRQRKLMGYRADA